MRTPATDLLGIEFPLLAFSHCRDVVAAVTNAGGFGVFGAMRYDADELEVELRWVDEQVRGRPYGVDVIVPRSFEGKGEQLDSAALAGRISPEHWDFLELLLAEHGLAGIWDRETAIRESRAAGRFSDGAVDDLLDVAFSHPIRLIANALGPAPVGMIERAREHAVPCAGLVGAPEHAVRQLEAGVDLVVASGYEAGGHTGEVGTIVLVPEVIAAVEGRVTRPRRRRDRHRAADGRRGRARCSRGLDGIRVVDDARGRDEPFHPREDPAVVVPRHGALSRPHGQAGPAASHRVA